ncbi:glycosyl hydrolase [Flagelloscypha sp. PMI_526]|nr:glycosyl hydrolase [Flagelloscypha sp. PMI_526]
MQVELQDEILDLRSTIHRLLRSHWQPFVFLGDSLSAPDHYNSLSRRPRDISSNETIMIIALSVLLVFILGISASDLVPRAGTFTNPLNTQKGADPCMRYINGKYFFSATQNTEIAIWSSTNITGLKTASNKKTVFTDSTAGRNYDFWAPEFWYLDGAWYIYYSVAGNFDDNTHRLYVLKGGTNSSDPTSGTYTHVSSLIPSNFDYWAVDGSILEVGGSRYLIYSGLASTTSWIQCTYIVKLSSPTTISGTASQISCPSYSWETVGAPVHEGQEALTVGNVTYIVYSASHCSSEDYALGLLTLKSGADPLVASSWTKSASPLFGKNTAAGVYGPGHHFMFQVGTQWMFAYHGKSAAGQGCGDLRTTRVQPFSVSSGSPVFPAAVATGVAVTDPA